MNHKSVRIVLFVAIGLLLGFGPVYLKLRLERTEYRKEIENLNNRFTLLQTKYSEEKARASGLLRTKATLEGQTRALQTDIERLEKEKLALTEQQGAVKGDCDQKILALEKRLEELSQKHAELTSGHEELQAKHAKTIKEYEAKTAELTAEKNRLDFGLKSETQKLERCRAHNGQLVGITNELTEKYRNKGVLGSALEKEPFTGLKRVEMEHLIQEYQDKIESHQLESQQP